MEWTVYVFSCSYIFLAKIGVFIVLLLITIGMVKLYIQSRRVPHIFH